MRRRPAWRDEQRCSRHRLPGVAEMEGWLGAPQHRERRARRRARRLLSATGISRWGRALATYESIEVGETSAYFDVAPELLRRRVRQCERILKRGVGRGREHSTYGQCEAGACYRVAPGSGLLQ